MYQSASQRGRPDRSREPHRSNWTSRTLRASSEEPSPYGYRDRSYHHYDRNQDPVPSGGYATNSGDVRNDRSRYHQPSGSGDRTMTSYLPACLGRLLDPVTDARTEELEPEPGKLSERLGSLSSSKRHVHLGTDRLSRELLELLVDEP